MMTRKTIKFGQTNLWKPAYPQNLG